MAATKIMRQKIQQTVKEYKTLFPEEYETVVEQIKLTRDNAIDKFSEVKSDTIQRRLVEWPETLYVMIRQNLTKEEADTLFNDKAHTEIRWFARTYPEFAVSEV